MQTLLTNWNLVGFNFHINLNLRKCQYLKKTRRTGLKLIYQSLLEQIACDLGNFNKLPHVFEVSYGFVIFFLTIVVYWAFLQPYIKELIAFLCHI